ncbi:MAG: ROK family protein, partial [bacterium]
MAGIDIGGTNLKAGLVSDAGKVEEFLREPVERNVTGEAFARQLATLVERMTARRPLAGIGVGVPATLRAAEGKALPRGCNLPGLNEFRLGDRLRELTSRPVHVANDADMAMAGEARFVAARGVRNAVAITIGTGIGTGLWLDGKLWEGAHGSGAE